MSTFDDNGLIVDDFATVLAALIEDLRSNFGENIKTSNDSTFGALANIFAEAVANQNDLVEQVSNAFNPQTAAGDSLGVLVQLNGLTRNADEFSTVTLSCTANTAGSSIPAGSLVSDGSGNQFATDALLVLAPSATDTVAATAVNSGVVEAAAGTLTTIDTPVYGWASVTNPSEATVGQSEETDAALRLRRQVVVEGSGTASVEAIFRAVSEIDEVTDTAVYDNVTGTTDADGIPGHSIWVIVDAAVGAAIDESVAQAIFDTKCAGIGMYGATTVTLTTALGFTYDVNFDRATERDVWIEVDLTTNSNYPSDGDDQIKQALVDYFDGEFELSDGTTAPGFGIGDDIIHSRLYTPINSVPGHEIDALRIGFSIGPTGTSTLTVSKDQKGITDTAKITVNS
jgi:uncharacterized phage protein gp47/JayE